MIYDSASPRERLLGGTETVVVQSSGALAACDYRVAGLPGKLESASLNGVSYAAVHANRPVEADFALAISDAAYLK